VRPQGDEAKDGREEKKRRRGKRKQKPRSGEKEGKKATSNGQRVKHEPQNGGARTQRERTASTRKKILNQKVAMSQAEEMMAAAW
jgi:hypothetical protein